MGSQDYISYSSMLVFLQNGTKSNMLSHSSQVADQLRNPCVESLPSDNARPRMRLRNLIICSIWACDEAYFIV